MTLLQQMTQERMGYCERLRSETLRQLRLVVRDIIPEQSVVVFGSVVKPHRFSDVSDIDLALWSEPPGMTIYQLSSVLAERIGRRVDVVLLSECRFRERILREGERWTPQD